MMLDVKNLKTFFFTPVGIVKAVDGVSFSVKKGEALGLVGESGSGKTVSALSVLRVLPRPGKIMDGSITFEGEDLLRKSEKEMRKIRGAKIAISFQDPTVSLNPLYTIGSQLIEVIKRHQNLDKNEAKEKAIELMKLVGISEPETRISQYPHQFSGGMRQRIEIARATSCNPRVLFADEPTTSVDVTIQAQILELIEKMRRQIKMALVLISHDIGLIAERTERVAVLYAGRVCEISDTRTVLKNPKHPYTRALLSSVPRCDQRTEGNLPIIPGSIPDLIDPPSGCRFHPRCEYATTICKREIPMLTYVEKEYQVACHNYTELNVD